MLNVKNKIFKNYVVLLILLFIDSLGNGVSNVILPEIIYKNEFGTEFFGFVVAVQSFVGIFILLPQASFIKKFGEIVCVRLGVLMNVIVYFFYGIGAFSTVALGKFVEGFADRLLNSSLSKLVYDFTDNSNNRGKYRALLDIVSNTGTLLGPIIVGLLLINSVNIAIPVIIICMIVGLFISYRFYSVEDKQKQTRDVMTTTVKEKTSKLNTYVVHHLLLYKKNKNIVFLTIPTFLFSCFDIFQSLLLGQFLLSTKGFLASDLALFWSINAGLTLLAQYPLGMISDKNKSILFYTSGGFLLIGFLGFLLFETKFLIILAGSILYIGGLGYSMAMSVLFGDMTTKENR